MECEKERRKERAGIKESPVAALLPLEHLGMVRKSLKGDFPLQVDSTPRRRIGSRSIITLDVNNALSYYFVMIVSFRCADTEALAKGRRVRRFVNIESVARRKLRQLQIAGQIEDLRVPPGNRLEALKGNRAGRYSIRVNGQFRVCFRWTAAGAEDVEIVDYH
jgi:toxin HigB-1